MLAALVNVELERGALMFSSDIPTASEWYRDAHHTSQPTNCCAGGDTAETIMIKLLLTDVDGTLIGTGSHIHPKVHAALQAAQKAGLHLGICTGRPLYSLAKDYAHLVSSQGVHIFQNGAHAGKLDGTIIHQSLLPKSAYLSLVQLSRDLGFGLEVYTTSKCYAEIQTEISLEHQRLIQLEVQKTDLLHLPEPVVRVQWVITPEQYGIIEAAMRPMMGISYSSASTPDLPHHLYTSVTRAGTSKLEGAQAVANFYGLSLDQVMMVGDGENDLEVLQGVGFGVAMGNAPDKVKHVSKAVVAHVNEGGLAQAIALALESWVPPV
ncbi:MAG: HAD family hydrolase [Deinococcales bacterium]